VDLYRIAWNELLASEPTPAEVEASAAALAAGYNEPENARLMGHGEPMSPEDVVDHYADMAEEGARQFLLFVDDKLVGDADLRGVAGGTAEFAFMIAARDLQGKGLGTRFALMVTAFGFAQLGLRRIYASLVPHNTGSRRVFEKLGYSLDEGEEARGYADEPGDIVMGIDRQVFEHTHAAALAQLAISTRVSAS
jgi:RimJ/RimL family protein N-acetyltransferase